MQCRLQGLLTTPTLSPEPSFPLRHHLGVCSITVCFFLLLLLLPSGDAFLSRPLLLTRPPLLSPAPGPHRLLAHMSQEANDREGLIVGVSKYSQDASVCIIEGRTGQVLYIGAKERLTRKKHDAGDVADLVEHALEAVGRPIDDVSVVVQNNRNFRICSFEKRLSWSVSLGHYPLSYEDETNLFPLARTRHELSHHLAHVWSAITQAPFDEGVVVVMDAMGERYREMALAQRASDKSYTHDLTLTPKRLPCFKQVPEDLDLLYSYREAESAYYFKGLDVQPVFKRWTKERSPSELPNCGLQDMESLGAVYSRVSSHIFGDANANGRVMALSPHGKNLEGMPRFMGGNLTKEVGQGGFVVEWERLEGLPGPNEWMEEDTTTFARYARAASRVQQDLEEAVVGFLKEMKQSTGATNLCLVGSVALNTVLNARVVRECGYDQVFIPPYPGDDGLCVGCAIYGLHQLLPSGKSKVAPWRAPLSPYQGKQYSEEDIREVLESAQGWLEYRKHESMEAVVEAAADALAQGRVVAWYQGRAEAGQRALGSRALLADPRKEAIARHINKVKAQELFRPLSAAILLEEASDWFQGLPPQGSPYMSLTVPTKDTIRHRIPAVRQVDGTARVQTVKEEDQPWFYRLVEAFSRRTGIPMLATTPLSIRGEPLVDSPVDALRTFLAPPIDGIHLLVLGDYTVSRRPFPPDTTQFDPSTAIPAKVPFYADEVRTHQESGMPTGVSIMVGQDVWLPLRSYLELMVLEAVTGLTPLEEVVEEVLVEADDDSVSTATVMGAIRSLFEERLLYFIGATS